MKFRIIIQNAAKVDLRKAALYYNEAKKGLGKEFLEKVKQNMERIKANPFIAQIRYFEVHTAVVEVFPYMIHYYLDSDKKAIVIIAVLHTSRDSEIWETRTGGIK